MLLQELCLCMICNYRSSGIIQIKRNTLAHFNLTSILTLLAHTYAPPQFSTAHGVCSEIPSVTTMLTMWICKRPFALQISMSHCQVRHEPEGMAAKHLLQAPVALLCYATDSGIFRYSSCKVINMSCPCQCLSFLLSLSLSLFVFLFLQAFLSLWYHFFS